MKMKVRDSLPFGRENIIPAKVLAGDLGFPSDRDLRKQIERERAAGAVILSDCHRGRYCLSNDPEKLRRFTRTMNARAKNTAKAAQSAQETLDAATEQEKMEGWWK